MSGKKLKPAPYPAAMVSVPQRHPSAKSVKLSVPASIAGNVLMTMEQQSGQSLRVAPEPAKAANVPMNAQMSVRPILTVAVAKPLVNAK